MINEINQEKYKNIDHSEDTKKATYEKKMVIQTKIQMNMLFLK